MAGQSWEALMAKEDSRPVELGAREPVQLDPRPSSLSSLRRLSSPPSVGRVSHLPPHQRERPSSGYAAGYHFTLPRPGSEKRRSELVPPVRRAIFYWSGLLQRLNHQVGDAQRLSRRFPCS